MNDTTKSPFDKEGTSTVTPDSLAELVGEGKKYATVEAALESIAPKEEHIGTLEAELAELRQKNESLETAVKALDDIKAGNSKSDQTDLDPDAIARLVDSRIESKNAEKTAVQNVDTVVTAMKTKFGTADKAKEAYEAKALELGMGVETLTEIAAKSPKAVLSYFDLKPETPAPTKTEGSVNTEALGLEQTSERDYEYWQKYRRENADYYTPDVQRLRDADVARLGNDRFFKRT
jgi:hypothetical protein